MMQRVQEMLRDVEKLPQQTIALVGHGGSIRGVLALLGGGELVSTLGWEIGYGAVIGVRI